MLIICTDEEMDTMRKTCDGECNKGCIFKDVQCPIEKNMVITDRLIERGKDLVIH